MDQTAATTTTTTDGSSNLDDGHKVIGVLSLLGLVIVLTVCFLLIAVFSLFMACRRRRIISVRWRSMSISIGGRRWRGLDAQSIDALPVYVYHHGNTENKQPSMKNSESFDCAICISVFEENEKVKSLLPCKHSFHADCIDMWLSSSASCPVCRCTVSCNAQGEADSGLSNPEQEEGIAIDVGMASGLVPRESFSSPRSSLSSSMLRMWAFNPRRSNGKEEPSSSAESQPEVRLHVDS